MTENIPYIHNYCDRWCERCSFTFRCAVAKMEGTYTNEEKDIENSAFWKKLSENITGSFRMLIREGKKWGLDLEKVTEEDLQQSKLQMEEVDALTEKDELIQSVEEYTISMKKVLEDFPYWIAISTGLARQTAMGVRDGETVLAEVRMLDSCRDVLSWYFIFINAKFRRAVSGKIENLVPEDEYQSDYNGSAKIAMIGVERSLQALTKIFDYTRDEDRLLPLLSLLTKIERLAKKKFPNADKFIRPGFDTAGSDSTFSPPASSQNPEIRSHST